jgi:preprotein translocase subunit SecY
MSQTTLFPLQSNPYPLGLTAPTSGTPLRVIHYVYSVLAYVDSILSQWQIAKLLSVQALPGNTGNVYVLNNSSAADTVNYSNVLAVLTPGSIFNSNAYAMGQVAFANFWIDVQDTGDGAISFIELV